VWEAKRKESGGAGLKKLLRPVARVSSEFAIHVKTLEIATKDKGHSPERVIIAMN